jgi:hypothetical protein
VAHQSIIPSDYIEIILDVYRNSPPYIYLKIFQKNQKSAKVLKEQKGKQDQRKAKAKINEISQ